jgi:hypothetical protein
MDGHDILLEPMRSADAIGLVGRSGIKDKPTSLKKVLRR